jgi:hypothetical protein
LGLLELQLPQDLLGSSPSAHLFAGAHHCAGTDDVHWLGRQQAESRDPEVGLLQGAQHGIASRSGKSRFVLGKNVLKNIHILPALKPCTTFLGGFATCATRIYGNACGKLIGGFPAMDMFRYQK